MNLKIVNEVGNSFDFYARQFSGDRIEQMVVSSDFVQKDLLKALEIELKVKIKKFSPVVMRGWWAKAMIWMPFMPWVLALLRRCHHFRNLIFLETKAPKSKFEGDIMKV